jgi:hypothetical protein
VLQEALTLYRKLGDKLSVAIDQYYLAEISLRAGRTREARDRLSTTLGCAVSSGDTEFLLDVLDLAAAIAAELGDCLRAARLTGAAQAIRQKAGMPNTQPNSAALERFLAPARATITPEAWDAELAAGRVLTQQQTVTLLRSLRPAPDALQ